jgi:PAS domain S-box-containing protein
MDDQQTALRRIRQLRWLVPLLAILLMVWLEVYYLFQEEVPLTRVLLDVAVGSAIAFSLTWVAFARVLKAQLAAAARSRQLSAFNLVASRLSTAAHLEDILANSMAALIEIAGAAAGGIYVPQDTTWSLAASHGLSEETVLAHSNLSQSDPWVRSVLAQGEALLGHEMPWEETAAEAPPGHARPCLSLPCFVGAHAVAIVFLLADEPNGFTSEMVSLLSTAATQVGMAVERGSLLDRAERRLHERELLLETVAEVASDVDLDALLPHIISAAMQAIPSAERGTIHLHDRNRDELTVRAAVGLRPEHWDSLRRKVGEGCAGWAYLHGKPLLVADTASDHRYRPVDLPGLGNAKSGIWAPLVTQEGSIGTLSLEDSSATSAFDDNDLRLLTAFAASAAVAIEHASALEEAHRLAAESGMLLIVGQLLASSRELDQVLRYVAEEGTALLRADGCSVSLYDPDSETLTLKAAEGFEAKVTGELSVRLPSEGHTRDTLRAGLPVVIAKGEAPDGRVPGELARIPGIESLLVVPLICRGTLTGVLVFFRKDEHRPFTENDRQLGMRLGHQAAVSIENAGLFARVNLARREWELTFNAIADAIFIVDPQANIRQVNESAGKLLGEGVDSLVGRSYYQLIWGTDGHLPDCPVARTLETGGPARAELDGLLLEGIFLISAWPVSDADGQVQGAVIILRDVTVEHHLRGQLLQAEKLSSLGQTIAGVAHELNNPLQTVVGYAQLLKTEEGLDEESLQEVDRIHDAGRRAAGIVRNLLTFARKQKPSREPTDVNESIIAALDLRVKQLETLRINVVSELADDLPLCLADSNQLQQIWHNLILNAQQAMLRASDRGVLTVRSFLKDSQTLRVEFSDDGPGIPADIMDRIFDPFFTTKKSGEGTGLGLSVCFGIARAHDAQIWAESEEGQGATFIIELPVAESNQQSG